MIHEKFYESDLAIKLDVKERLETDSDRCSQKSRERLETDSNVELWIQENDCLLDFLTDRAAENQTFIKRLIPDWINGTKDVSSVRESVTLERGKVPQLKTVVEECSMFVKKFVS